MPERIFWAIPASALYTGRDSDAPAVRLVLRGLEILKAGNLNGAEHLAQEALETARKEHHPLGEGTAALFFSNLLWGTNRTLQALELARRARRVFQQQPGLDQRHNEAIAALNLGLVRHLMGDYTGALNEYDAARRLLETAHRYWTSQKESEQAQRCKRFIQWVEHLIGRLIDPAPHGRTLTLFLPVSFANGATATLWGEYARDPSLILDERTLRIVPLRGWLILTTDCCVFPIPDPQVHRLIQQQVGADGDYILAQPSEPLPGDLFYISLDLQGITSFLRQDGTVIATVQTVRILGGATPARYRPMALAV